jgi:hypothetical protein
MPRAAMSGARPRRRQAAALLGLGLLAAAALLFAAREPATEPKRSRAAAIVPIALPPVPLPRLAAPAPAPHAGAGATPAASQPPDAAEFVRAALRSEDLRLRAQAWRLLRACEFVLAPAQARPLVAPAAWMQWETVRRADAAWQALSERCRPLGALGDGPSLQRRLDPVPPAAGSGAATAQWLAASFERHGGAALLWAGDALVAHVERRRDDPDGDRFDTLDPEAVQIARCRFGEDCGPDSAAAHAACLTLGACEGDVPQRLLSSLGSRPDRERVLRQAAALAEGLRSRRMARFALP